MTDALKIPAELLPADGRFGAGPSKIQTSHLDALAATGDTLMGTSHRQAPVKKTVGRVREDWPPSSTCPRATRSCSATAARPPSGTSPASA